MLFQTGLEASISKTASVPPGRSSLKASLQPGKPQSEATGCTHDTAAHPLGVFETNHP